MIKYLICSKIRGIIEQTAASLSHFEQLEDPRVDRTKRYPLIEIVFLVIYKEGIPVDDTIARVMRKIDTKQFRDCFINWMKNVSLETNGEVAIDGKTLCGSYDTASNKSPIHMVSAWSTTNSMVLGQEKTLEKSNEITAIPELLEILELKGCIVSIDAMGYQTKIAYKMINKEADYILALKVNQGLLHSDEELFFNDAIESNFTGVKADYHYEVDARHGRIETKKCWVINPFEYKECFSDLEKWKNLTRIIMVKTKRELKNKITEDTRFYLTSHIADDEFLLNAVRKHWQVENQLHWMIASELS